MRKIGSLICAMLMLMQAVGNCAIVAKGVVFGASEVASVE